MSIASDEDLNIQFDLMALDLKQAAQMKIPNFSLMHNLISKLEQQESPQQSQQNQQQQQKNQNQEDQLKFVWVNLLDFTIVGYDNTQLTGDYQLFPFIPNWIVPLDSNNVPLWDMEDMPQQQWDFENPPQKPDGTQWFDPQNLPKFQFVGQRFYPFIFKSHDTVDTEHPFYFVAVQLKDSKLKVLWKANLKEDGVFIVPFSNKFFTVEGQTIESTTWWDFKNPPTLSGQNSPLWTGNVQTTYPVFLFDKTKFETFKQLFKVNFQLNHLLLNFKNFVYVSKDADKLVLAYTDTKDSIIVPWVCWWFEAQRKNENNEWIQIFPSDPLNIQGQINLWSIEKPPLKPESAPFWTPPDLLDGNVRFQLKDQGYQMFKQLFGRKIDNLEKDPFFVPINIYTKLYELDKKPLNSPQLIIRNWNPSKFKPVGSYLPWSSNNQPTSYWDPQTPPVVSSTASWTSDNAPTAYEFLGPLRVANRQHGCYLLKPSNPDIPTQQERTALLTTTKALQEFVIIPFEPIIFEVYRGQMKIVDLIDFDIDTPPIDEITQQPIWTQKEFIEGTIQFVVKTEIYKQIFNNANDKTNKLIPVNVETKKVDFSRSVLDEKILFVPYDPKLFEVYLTSNNQKQTAPNNNWSIWIPFNSLWTTSLSVTSLPVYFKFIGIIPDFITKEEMTNEKHQMEKIMKAQAFLVCINRNDYLIDWKTTLIKQCNPSTQLQLPFNHFFFAPVNAEGTLAWNDQSAFLEKWDLLNPPLSLWDPKNIRINDPSTYPKLKFLEGDAIQKIMFKIDDLNFKLDPIQYSVQWSASKIYTHVDQKKWPCFLNQKIYDEVKRIIDSDPDLEFPGLEGWGCQNVRSLLNKAKNAEAAIDLKSEDLQDTLKKYMEEENIPMDQIQQQAINNGENVPAPNPNSQQDNTQPIEPFEPGRRRILAGCNDIPLSLFIRQLMLAKMVHVVPDSLKDCTDVDTYLQKDQLSTLTKIPLPKIKQILSQKPLKPSPQQLLKLASLGTQLIGLNLSLPNDRQQLQKILKELFEIIKPPKELKLFFDWIMTKDLSDPFYIKLLDTTRKELLSLFQDQNDEIISPEYYKQLLQQLKVKKMDSLESSDLTTAQITALFQGVNKNVEALSIPSENLAQLKGKILALDFTVKVAGSDLVLLQDTRYVEILDDQIQWTDQTNANEQIKIFVSTDNTKTAISKFQTKTTYKISSKISNIEQRTSSSLIWGRVGQIQETLTITEDQTVDLALPQLVYGLEMYVFALKIITVSNNVKSGKYVLVVKPYLGLECTTLQEKKDIKDLVDISKPPTSKADLDSYIETLKMNQQDEQDKPKKEEPPKTDSSQKRGPVVTTCSLSTTEIQCNGNGQCQESDGVLKCVCGATFGGKQCEKSKTDFNNEISFNKQALNLITFPSDESGQIQAAQSVKAMIKQGSVDKQFIQKVKEKFVDNVNNANTLPAVKQLIDTIGELAKSNVDVAGTEETNSAQQEGISMVQTVLDQAVKLAASTPQEFIAGTPEFNLKLPVADNNQVRRQLVDQIEKYYSTQPLDVQPSEVSVFASNPILAENRIVLEIIEYNHYSGVKNSSYLLTPLTEVHFVSKSNGQLVDYNDKSNPIQMKLYLIENVQQTQTYKAVKLNEIGTTTAAFDSTGIEIVTKDQNWVTIKVTSSGAYGIMIVENVVQPPTGDNKEIIDWSVMFGVQLMLIGLLIQ